MKQINDETFLKSKGWKLVKGRRIDLNNCMDHDGEDYIYFHEENIDDWCEPCEFWNHDSIERVYEDIDLLLETEYEEYLDSQGTLYDKPVQEVKKND